MGISLTFLLSALFLFWIAATVTTTNAMSTTASMKRILVTGGNKGIGKAICEKLLKDWNDTVVLLGARDAERGHAAIQDIVREVGDCRERLQLVVVDTSSDASVKQAAAKLEAEPPLYGIINNAGVSRILLDSKHDHKDSVRKPTTHRLLLLHYRISYLFRPNPIRLAGATRWKKP